MVSSLVVQKRCLVVSVVEVDCRECVGRHKVSCRRLDVVCVSECGRRMVSCRSDHRCMVLCCRCLVVMVVVVVVLLSGEIVLG